MKKYALTETETETETETDLLTTLKRLERKINRLENLVDNNVDLAFHSNSSALSYIDDIKTDLRDGKWNVYPERKISHDWDKLVDTWIETIPTIGDKIPSAYRIWQSANRYLKAGMLDRADRCERLNYIFHNSYIPSFLELESEIIFAYGGISVIIHKDAEIAPSVTIDANVTIGGNGNRTRLDERKHKITTVPKIDALIVIGASANITGDIEIGPLAIIAPNAVVVKSIPAGSIIAGLPGKEIGRVTRENALSYKAKFLPARSWSDERYVRFVEQDFTE